MPTVRYQDLPMMRLRNEKEVSRVAHLNCVLAVVRRLCLRRLYWVVEVWNVEVLDNCFGAGHIEFAGRVHEVELRVDVPEEEARRHGRDLGGAPLPQLDSFGTVVTSDRLVRWLQAIDPARLAPPYSRARSSLRGPHASLSSASWVRPWRRSSSRASSSRLK